MHMLHNKFSLGIIWKLYKSNNIHSCQIYIYIYIDIFIYKCIPESKIAIFKAHKIKHYIVLTLYRHYMTI